jgi:Tol biopolymer transport system component
VPVAPRKIWAAGLVVTAVATGGLAVTLLVNATTAEAAVGGSTVRVSVASDETEGRDGNQPAISGDGRYVAFTTTGPLDDRDTAANAGENDLDQDVYVRDTVTGTTMLVSHAANPKLGAAGDSSSPSVSGTGRYIAFQTSSEDIVPSGWSEDDVDNVNTRVVVCDRDPDNDGRFAQACVFTEVSEDERDAVQPHLSARGDVVQYRSFVSSAPPPLAARSSWWP